MVFSWRKNANRLPITSSPKWYPWQHFSSIHLKVAYHQYFKMVSMATLQQPTPEGCLSPVLQNGIHGNGRLLKRCHGYCFEVLAIGNLNKLLTRIVYLTTNKNYIIFWVPVVVLKLSIVMPSNIHNFDIEVIEKYTLSYGVFFFGYCPILIPIYVKNY
jgi:hypothetical protein